MCLNLAKSFMKRIETINDVCIGDESVFHYRNSINQLLNDGHIFANRDMPSKDLNDCTTQGKYTFDNHGDYQNAATQDGICHVVVFGDGREWIIQLYFWLIWGGNDPHLYIRQYSPPGWSNWKQIT